MMANTSGVRIPQFGGEQYAWQDWRVQFEALLDDRDLLSFIMESPEPAEGASGYDEHKDRSRKLYNQLALYTKGVAMSIVRQSESARDGRQAWQALLAKYEQKSTARRVALQQQLFSRRLTIVQDPDEFFVELDDLRRKISSLGADVGDDMMTGIVMSALPAEYEPVAVSLSTRDHY